MTQAIEILILDDERDAANMMAEFLTLKVRGAIVRVVYAGEDAVSTAAERRPDAVILDLEMGGLDGEAVAQALRSAFPDPRLLLIALSGNVIRLGALRNTGIFDFLLSKPVDIAALVELLNKVPACDNSFYRS